MVSERTSQNTLYGVSALLFAGSAALTTLWCASMSAMGEIRMPGRWTMSMAWVRMPGRTWGGATLSFVGAWFVMMVAMMLPPLVPILARYRHALIGRSAARIDGMTALVGTGYFVVWTAMGMAIYPLGVALAAIEMQEPAVARAVPVAMSTVVLIAGAFQFTHWKVHHLACCRELSRHGRALVTDAGSAWQYGLHLGLHCAVCCVGLTAILLVVGIMDLRAMAVVTAAVTLERLAPAGEGVSGVIGAVAIGAGLLLFAGAVGIR